MKTFFDLIKIKHWIKNLFVFAPLIFSLNLFNVNLCGRTVMAFFAFCFVSVFVYIINDILDKNNDLHHPTKSLRPIASGKIHPIDAAIIGFVFFALGIGIGFYLNVYVCLFLGIYFVMNVAYSLWLKKIVILDVFIIAIGFCIRVIVGSLTIGTPLSHWMLLATFGLSLFLGFSKRLNEIQTLGDSVESHRQNYSKYTTDIIDKFIMVSAAIAVISYSFYTIDVQTVGRFGDYRLSFTIPFVVFGVFRYIYLVYCENKGSNPEELAVKDVGIVLSVGLWVLTILYLLYVPNGNLSQMISFF